MLMRLKFQIDKLVNEMLDQLPEEVWLNPSVTVLDPAMGGGQFLKEVIPRLCEKGHLDENIERRVFDVAEDEIDLNRARKNAKLIGKYGTVGVDFDFEREFGLKFRDFLGLGNPRGRAGAASQHRAMRKPRSIKQHRVLVEHMRGFWERRVRDTSSCPFGIRGATAHTRLTNPHFVNKPLAVVRSFKRREASVKSSETQALVAARIETTAPLFMSCSRLKKKPQFV